jgi:hypothetical protein
MALAERATLIAELRLDDKMSSGIHKVSGSLGRLSNSLKHSQAISTAVGVGLERVVSYGIQSLSRVLPEIVQAGSDLAETQSKIGVVFGESSKEMLAWGMTAAKAMGMSANEALTAAGTYGNLFVALKLGKTQTDTMSKGLVQLAADLASFNNVEIGDALEALRAGMVGETEPLRRFGVNMNDATLKSKALEMGLIKLSKGQKTYGGVLDPAIKAQAAYALIMEQTATAQGDFARTSGGLANQQRILSAQIQSAAAVIGTELLPVVTDVVKQINDELAKPQTTEILRSLGKGMAAGFKQVVDFVKTVPWGTIIDAMGTAAGVARTIADVFLNMPPWVQTAVLTGWGLNKLTGGALTGLAGGIGAAGVIASGAILVAALATTWKGFIEPGLQEQATANNENALKLLKTGSLADLQNSLRGLKEMPGKLNPLQKVLYDLNAAGVKVHTEELITALESEIDRRTREQTAKITRPPTGQWANTPARWPFPGRQAWYSGRSRRGRRPRLPRSRRRSPAIRSGRRRRPKRRRRRSCAGMSGPRRGSTP